MNEDIDQKLLQRFEIIQKIRKTNSGVIWKAIDRKSNSLVAIKKIDPNSKPIHLLKSTRETLILQELPKHPGILKVFQVINKATDQYIIYEFVEMDLLSLIRVNILEMKHIQLIMYNILVTLHYIHSGGLIHLNLVPSKILIDQECQIKLIGFGFSQVVPVSNVKYTNLHYLAPEILLQGKVSYGADVWALGCIFGELLCQNTLFTGTTSLNQLEKIVELIGKPAQYDISEMTEFILNAISTEKQISFSNISTDSVAIDLLKRMLTFDPAIRISVQDILKHPFLKLFYNQQDIKSANIQFSNIEDMSLKAYQEILRERSKKLDPLFVQTTYQQQDQANSNTNNTKRKSQKELSPGSIVRQKSAGKIRFSPGQSPATKKEVQEPQSLQLRKKGTLIKS